MSKTSIPVRRLFGISIHAATMDQVLAACRCAIDARQSLVIGVVNAAKIVRMRQDPRLRDSVCSSDLILADGMAVVWASRILRKPLPERVAGVDLFERLLALADQRRYAVYFLGATQTVLDEVLRRVRAKYPWLHIAGSHNGYFPDAEAEAVAAGICAARPDMLFVAMTSPKKEVFLGRWGTHLDVRVCHGVGGSFDVFAGVVKRAPPGWRRLGLEWLYRVLQEPGRMWRRYLVTNTLFIGLLLRELVVGRGEREPAVNR